MIPTTRIPGLDGLRGLACVAVFAANFHHVFPGELHLGFLDFGRFLEGGAGVVILFVLSGFLLAIPYWAAMLGGGEMPSVASFWLKRLARLLPAYFIALTVLILHNRHWENQLGTSDILLHYSFLFNFTDFSFYSINPPFWALGIIAQFYLLLPLLFHALRRMPPAAASAAFAVMAAAAYAAHAALLTAAPGMEPWPFPADVVSRGGPVLTHSILAHLPHFLFGVLAAFFFVRKAARRPAGRLFPRVRFDAWFWIAAVAAVGILSTPAEDLLQVPFGRYTLPWVPALLALVIYAAPQAMFTSALLEIAPLRWLGVLSYGVYVYHLPVINLTARYAGRLGVDPHASPTLLAGTAFVVTLAVALLSYRLIERPVLRVTRRWLKAGAGEGPAGAVHGARANVRP